MFDVIVIVIPRGPSERSWGGGAVSALWSSSLGEGSMAAMEDGTEEAKQKLMDKEEIPEAKKLSKRDGTR